MKVCRLNSSNEKASKNSLHLLMLMAGPLQNKQNTVFEVLEAWVSWHTVKSCVNLLLSWNLNTPVDKMIFEDTFVKLMENVGVKQVNMLVCGRSAQKGLSIGLISSFVKAATWRPLALCSRITLVHPCSCFRNSANSPCSSCRTLHSGQ